MYEILLTVAFAITSILALPAATDGPIPGIFAKTFLPDCAIEGRFSDNPTSKPFGPQVCLILYPLFSPPQHTSILPLLLIFTTHLSNIPISY